RNSAARPTGRVGWRGALRFASLPTLARCARQGDEPTMNLSTENLFAVDGKSVLVTGGSRGIGEMVAAGFLANGAAVYISSRKADVCDATAERLAKEYGGTCVSIPANLAELEGIEVVASELARHESKLDVLINNAGVSWGASLEEFPEIGWDKVM